MNQTRLLTSIAVFLLLGPLVTSCGGPSGSLSGADPVSVGPMNEKERLEAERWARATRGLDFDAADGLVRVEPAFPGNRSDAPRYLAQGDELLAANRVMDALEQYGLAARNDPALADAYVGIGVVMKRKGRLDPALASFRTAIERDDAHLGARYQLAVTLWTAAEKDQAMAEMQAVLDVDRDHPLAHERLAVWNYYEGNFADAWEHLHRAEALGRSVPPQLIPLLEERMPDPGIGTIER